MYNSYQPLEGIVDHHNDESFLGADRGDVHDIRNLERGGEELDEGYNKKRKLED